MRYFLFVIVFFFYGCDTNNIQDHDDLEKHYQLNEKNDTLFYLNLKSGNEKTAWELPYPVFRLDEGDVNGDGVSEALVGVIKKTRFDSIERKRLFIFKNHDGYVRPMWLGSKLSYPLIDFRYWNGYILTLEQVSKKEKAYFLYQWNSFGLKYIDKVFSL